YKVPVEKLILGYRQVNFIQPENLEDEQLSYTRNFNGFNSTAGKPGDWKEEWTVIASDEIGAPVFIDRNTGFIHTAVKDENEWNTYRVANSFELYLRYIEIMSKLTEGRETPEDFRTNPVPEIVSEAILTEIEKKSVDCELWYWELFLEDLWVDPNIESID
ncbi:MAG: hypothetical protein HYZ42_18785, partial [Bacteroidetes bacterium]|nr:hypothetical protein [Bacteroidota bacterium]